MSVLLGDVAFMDFPVCWKLSGKEATAEVQVVSRSCYSQTLLVQLAPMRWSRLTADGSGDALAVTMSLKPLHRLEGFRVQSNARFFEVYHSSPNVAAGEWQYLSTSKGTASATNSSEKVIIYSHDYLFPGSSIPPDAKFHFKFVSLRQGEDRSRSQGPPQLHAHWNQLQLMMTLPEQPVNQQKAVSLPMTPSVTPSATAAVNESSPQASPLSEELLRQMLNEVQAMRADLTRETQHSTAAATATTEASVLQQAISSLMLPNSPLQCVLSHLQRSLVNDMATQLERQFSPVVQRLDKLEAQINRLTVLADMQEQRQLLQTNSSEVQTAVVEVTVESSGSSNSVTDTATQSAVVEGKDAELQTECISPPQQIDQQIETDAASVSSMDAATQSAHLVARDVEQQTDCMTQQSAAIPVTSQSVAVNTNAPQMTTETGSGDTVSSKDCSTSTAEAKSIDDADEYLLLYNN